jgi:hypothetical protein
LWFRNKTIFSRQILNILYYIITVTTMGGPHAAEPGDKKVSPFLSAIIGGITGAMEISITYPTEYTKTVM